MLSLAHGVRVYLCTQPTDMRKSFDGLIGATRAVIGEDPLSGHLFIFTNRQANYAKAIYFTRGGYCLWAKKLESGQFARYESSSRSVQLTDTQLMMWLDGIEMGRTVQKKRFVRPQSVASSATMSG